MTRTAPSRLVTALLLFVVAIGLSSCDAVIDEDRLFFNNEDLTFDFVFQGSQVTIGEALTVNAGQNLNLTQFLQARGYTPNDLVGAVVEDVMLEQSFPLTTLSYVEDVQFFLTRSGASAQEVASGSGLASRESVSLSATGTDVSALLQQVPFTGRLQLTTSSIDPEERYEVRVVFSLRLEVQGI